MSSLKRLMSCKALVLAAVALVANESAAKACETIAADAKSPIEIRQPLSGAARLAAGFGIRNHPILMILKMHTGVDWAAALGQPVLAAGRGQVVSARRDGAYGNTVIIDHGGSWETLYAHLQQFKVKAGDCVVAGNVIGLAGATGLVEASLLHFEVRRDGVPVDPMAVGKLGGQ